MSSRARRGRSQRLIELGVPFRDEGGALHLTREGGHSHRRIVHVADATGAAVQQALETAALKHPNITLIPTWSPSI
jgi:L-aspartate oxidase